MEFDPEVAELLLVGMVVTGTYNLLSDGTWCFTQVRHKALFAGALSNVLPRAIGVHTYVNRKLCAT